MRLSLVYDVLPKICYTEMASAKKWSRTVDNMQGQVREYKYEIL